MSIQQQKVYKKEKNVATSVTFFSFYNYSVFFK